MIVALARKLIIALWRFVATGEPFEGVVLRPAPEKADRNEHSTQHHSARALAVSTTAELTIQVDEKLVFEPGADGPAGELAADAHDRIMVRMNNHTEYESVARRSARWRLPRILDDDGHDDAGSAKSPSRSSSSLLGVLSVEALRNAARSTTSRNCCVRSFDPLRRSPDLMRSDGTKTASHSERRDGTTTGA